MADLALLQRRLAAAKNLTRIAGLAGVTRMTAMRIRSGTHTPNLETFNRLELALNGKASPAKVPAERSEPKG